MRVGVISWADPEDPRSWSGTLRSMLDALRAKGFDVVALPWQPAPPTRAELLRQRVERIVGRAPAKELHSWRRAHAHARALAPAIASAGVDVLFAPAGSTQVAALQRPHPPLVYLSDATVALLDGYYERFSNLPARARREARAVESAALRRADVAVLSSQWAAASAAAEGGLPPERVRVVPFGATTAASNPPASRTQPGDPLRLLWVGVDWQRKGGAMAVAAAACLRAAGRAVQLDVVGCLPPEGTPTEGVIAHGRLARNDSAQAGALAELFAAADVLLLPTVADCSPIVLCEAASYGLPVLATRTGGVPELVVDGETGLLLAPGASAQEWAGAVQVLADDTARYAAHRVAARARYEQRLSWAAWADDLAEVLAAVAR